MRPDAGSLTRQFSKACRCHTAKAAVQLLVIVIHLPRLRNVFPLYNTYEQLAIESQNDHLTHACEELVSLCKYGV